MKLQQDLREFIELLNSQQIDFIVVGGYAVAYHGYPRFTGDVDFLIRPTLSNAQRVIAALSSFGFAELTIAPEDLLTENRVIQLGKAPNRIDILTSISGVSFADAWRGRVAAILDELPVFMLGFKELIANKTAAGRAKDSADVAQLLLVAKQNS